MPMLTLGQSGYAFSVVVWVGVLIVVVLIGSVVIFKIRRQMLEQDDSMNVGSSGLLDHLHQMQRSGEIDAEEFSKARSAILRRVQEDAEDRKNAKPASKPSILDGLDELDMGE